MRHHKVFEFSREAVQVGVAWAWTIPSIEHAQELALGNGHQILASDRSIISASAVRAFCWTVEISL